MRQEDTPAPCAFIDSVTSLFGRLPSGEKIEKHVLRNSRGFSVEILPYGATIVSVYAPDRKGNLTDVVLGFPSLEGYLLPHPYIGAVAGRVAGRISGARFVLDGHIYKLAANDPPNHLHGGKSGFDRKVWRVTSLSENAMHLTCRSADGEEGYPGEVTTSVTYTITEDNALRMETDVATTRATPVSLTQHTYFNLAGQGDVLGHELQILANEYAPTDERMTLLGRREKVQPNDFRQSRLLAEAVPKVFERHGDLYFLSKTDGLRTAAILREPSSGRVLTVHTNEDCLQFYSGASLDGSLIGKSGRPYGQHAGLCLECEGYPDGANTPALGDIVLRPGQTRHTTTVYAFSTDP